MTKKHDDPTLDDIEAALASDLLDPSTPMTDVERSLKNAGGDPSDIRKEGVAFVEELLTRRRLAWQELARQRIARRAPLLERIANFARLTRDQILGRLNDLRRDSRPVAAAFHKRKPEESTTEELRALLEEAEALRAIEASERKDEDDQ